MWNLFSINEKAAAWSIDLNDIANFAKVAQLESFGRAARALGMPGHAMLGFKIDQQKEDCPDDGRTRAERKAQRNDRSQGAKLDWPTPVSVGFIVHRIGVSICHS